MDWWEHLTPGQGTLLGGLAVLSAGILAFSNGWFERRAMQRRFHYDEMKQIYIDAIKYAMQLNVTGVPRQDVAELRDAMLKINTELYMIADWRTAAVLNQSSREASDSARSKAANPAGEVEAEAETEAEADAETESNSEKPLHFADVLEQVRKDLAQYVPRHSQRARALRESVRNPPRKL